jgi:hypothetical protein
LRLRRVVDAVGPSDEIVTDRPTAPVKPLKPVRLMDVELSLCPTCRVRDVDGSAATVKSTKWNSIAAVVWVRVPFTPVTVTV